MSRTLLIVDDIKSNRQILKNILGDEYDIIEASDGREALDIINNDFDRLSAVLLDLRMPVMDGFEVLSQIHGNRRLSQIPVIVMTGQTDADTEEQALKLGAKDYISKPYKSAIIKQRIGNTINLRETAATVNAMRRDRLTGLYNREAFFEQVSMMASMHAPGYYVMACFDVDKFKFINDQYGTQKGDDVLRYIARIFSRGFEPRGGICCRVSADDFAVFYPTAFWDSPELAEIRKQAGQVEGLITPLAFSVGRYIVDDLTLSPSAMYDRAMLAAESIKGRYDVQIAQYDESLRDKILQVQEIVTDMESALRERQFEAWYQPQYNHSTGALIGAEALARWRHPKRGMISPGVFVPVFEKNGFIYTLDKYIWEEACKFLRGEIDEGREPLPVSVNVSRNDAFRPDIVDVITGLTQKYELPARLLRLEITESAFADETREIVSVVKQLIARGFTLEIDDFGSGYSSLNTLKNVPAQVVKLDMRFFDDDRDNLARSGNIVESVVRMTKWLGMSVIAEGVEQIEQADFLRSIGCSYIQGYLYARPMPLNEYAALCRKTPGENKLNALETVDNLNNNSFWDPKSMDTLIFNSLVGGACIFEYRQGRIELLRATEKYAQVIGSAGMTVEDALKLDWTEHLDADNVKKMIVDLNQSIKTRKEVTGDYVFLDLPGCPHKTYLRTTMRVIASVGDRYLVYCMNENTTARRMSETRERETAERMQAIMDNVDLGIIAAVVSGDSAEYVFANNYYYEMLGYTKEQFEREVKSPYDTIALEDRQRVMEETRRINVDRESIVILYRAMLRGGGTRVFRSAISLSEMTGVNGPVQLTILRDITEETEIEKRERMAAEQVRLIMNDIGSGITAALLDDDGQIELLFTNDKFFELHGYTREQYEREVKDKFDLVYPDDREQARRDTIKAYSTRTPAQLEYRLVRRDGSICWVRVDLTSTRFTGIDRNVHLCIFTDITPRKRAETELKNTTALLRGMMNDMPGGFVRAAVAPNGDIKAIYSNDGFKRLTGMTREELLTIYDADVFAGVHPDDKPLVRETLSQLMENGEARGFRYRLRNKNGYVWLAFFGRVTRDSSGCVFLNLYFTDATEQAKEDERQKELLDNLPYGAALYELRGGALSSVHINKRYWELVGRGETAYSGTDFLKAVYPEDMEIIRGELNAAISENRDIACDVRIASGDGSYKPFHIAASLLKKEDGRYSIYAVYTPISDEAMSVQEMLPVALSAVMGKQADYAFIKDKSRRYVSCSAATAKLAGVNEPEDMIGKRDDELLDASLAEIFRQDDERILMGDTIIDRENRLPTQSGGDRFAVTSKFPLKDARGSVIGIYGFGHDVTEERRLKSQLELLTESIPGGLATYACTKGDFSPSHIKITYFNDGFCRMFSFTREEYAKRASENPASMVFEEDLPLLDAQWLRLIEDGTPIDCLYRAHVNGGGSIWISHKAVIADRQRDTVIINAILQDVTDQKELIEQLRISQEENTLAARLGENIVCRYLIAERTLTLSPDVAQIYSLPATIEDVPEAPVRDGMISPETADAYTGFFDGILRGSKAGTVTYQQRYFGDWRWMEAKSSTIFSDDGKPVKAIISIQDVTEKLEKETIYRKWQQSLSEKDPASYSLYRCDLNNDSVFTAREGNLIDFDFKEAGRDYNERARAYLRGRVYAEDREAYLAFANSDTLLAGYYRGRRSGVLEYRETIPSGDYRWLRLTVDLVEYPNSNDVEAYLMYEDIDKLKRQELQTKELAENDPLTGVLNRTAFASRVDSIIADAHPGSRCALLMLDIDGFKQVNDVFGHGAGDQTLVDITGEMRAMLRKDDLLGRIGGDEFVVFLSNVKDDASVMAKAMRICAVARKSLSLEVSVTGSIGISVYPRDGEDFERLYAKADAAMYYVKGSGKDNCAFYLEDMADQHLTPEKDAPAPAPLKEKKRRMLIVDDNELDHLMLTEIFVNEFIVEKAKDGNSALVRMRHYGSAVSVVLLDLNMPDMDGYAVLDKMREAPETRGIPVIVVSADESQEAGLRAIRAGAVDFVSKPVDPDILRVRVESAISKAENERLRVKNSLLEYRESEIVKYRTALSRSGLVVVEQDWVSGGFTYDRDITAHIAGKFDGRGLWQILLADFVADTATVKKMQEAVHAVASDRQAEEGQLIVRLKTPAKGAHLFRMGINKALNTFGLTDKLYLTFIDLGARLPASAMQNGDMP